MNSPSMFILKLTQFKKNQRIKRDDPDTLAVVNYIRQQDFLPSLTESQLDSLAVDGDVLLRDVLQNKVDGWVIRAPVGEPQGETILVELLEHYDYWLRKKSSSLVEDV